MTLHMLVLGVQSGHDTFIGDTLPVHVLWKSYRAWGTTAWHFQDLVLLLEHYIISGVLAQKTKFLCLLDGRSYIVLLEGFFNSSILMRKFVIYVCEFTFLDMKSIFYLPEIESQGFACSGIGTLTSSVYLKYLANFLELFILNRHRRHNTNGLFWYPGCRHL